MIFPFHDFINKNVVVTCNGYRIEGILEKVTVSTLRINSGGKIMYPRICHIEDIRCE
jgi:hypothetical protein